MADGGDSNDGLWLIFLVLAFVCGVLFLIWYIFTPQLLQLYLWIRQGEMAVASLWTANDFAIQFMTENGLRTMTFGEAKELLHTITPTVLLQDNVNHWQIINATSLAVLKPLRIPFGLVLLGMSVWAVLYGPNSHFRKTYNLQQLMEAQSKTFPVISPILNLNPLKDIPPRAPGALVPAELPLFAEALGPEEWVAYTKNPMPDGKLDREAAEDALAEQLGEPWQGAKKIPSYMQVLLAAFALKASRKREDADDLLGELALCWNHKSGLQLKGELVAKARKILKDKSLSGGILSECNRHAFVTTALIGALDYARSEGGVLAPAQFVWLRGHNRALWYPLNNLGRQAFHAEAMGAMSHYRTERQVKRPVPKPMLKDAVDSLEAYINDKKKSSPIPQLDFSMVKNKKAPEKNKGVMKPVGTAGVA